MFNTRKYLLILIIPLSILSCQFVTSGQVKAPTSVEVRLPTVAKLPLVAVDIPGQTITPISKPTGLTVVALKPSDGNLNAQLANHALIAKGLNQMPVVDFSATWCSACIVIVQSLAEQDQRMLDAFDGVYLIEVDVDEWSFADWEKGNYGFKFDGIPVFFKLDEQGLQTGEVIDGNAWGENIPENIAPPMDKFFHP